MNEKISKNKRVWLLALVGVAMGSLIGLGTGTEVLAKKSGSDSDSDSDSHKHHHHSICYTITDIEYEKTEPGHEQPGAKFRVKDQFGTKIVTVDTAAFLCAPAKKRLAPATPPT